MTSTPDWMINFLRKFRNPEIPKVPEKQPPVFQPYCPGRLGERADIHEFQIGDRKILACGLYERNRDIGFRPSRESCPGCKYNTDAIRQAADRELARKVQGFLDTQAQD